MTPRAGSLLLLAALLALTACGPDVRGVALQDVPGGDKSRGKAAIAEYGCGSCHVIPGIPGAQGLVGPPLTSFARRKYIVGALPNTPDNLIAWLRDPQAIEPGTVMPTIGLTEAEARDLAAYLATLR
jgi:cytochrome c1